MTAIRGLWRDKRSGIFYIRRKIPEALRPAFACGEFYKVTAAWLELQRSYQKRGAKPAELTC